MRRKKLVLALAVGLLAAPLLVFLVVPQAHLRLYALVLSKRLASQDKAVRERTRKKLLELGRPAIDGVLPELVTSVVSEWSAMVFVGSVRSNDGEYVFYDILEILPDDPQHTRKGEHPFTPGIRLEWEGEEHALRSRRTGPKLVMTDESRAILILSVDLDDPAVGALVVEAVSAKLRDPAFEQLRLERQMDTLKDAAQLRHSR